MDFAEIWEIPDRDERLSEILVDAYGEDEQMSAFENYLLGSLELPCEALWRDPDEKGHNEPVKVLEVGEADWRRGVMLKVERVQNHKVRQVEADQIWPQPAESNNAQMLGDYRHWAGNALDKDEEDEGE